jgi:cystathionine gamma-synthase
MVELSGLTRFYSLALNPASLLYPVLKESLDATYTNCVFEHDTTQLEANSRDFLSRASCLNITASYIVQSLRPFLADPASILSALYYPQICWSTTNYRAQMHQPTNDFTPGFGGVFTMEFEDVELASIFFNDLNVHKGPSLGANITLAQPYVQTVFHSKKAGQQTPDCMNLLSVSLSGLKTRKHC